jgi:hypothetical protein
MADGSGAADADFLDAVEEASQAGPLPEPPKASGVAEPLPDTSSSPTQPIGLPSPRKRGLISPTRPLPQVAAPTITAGRPAPDARRNWKRSRTTAGAPSLLMRATSAATPYPPLRIDEERSESDTVRRGGDRKPSMPAPVTVQARAEGSRPIQLGSSAADSRPIVLGDDSHRIDLRLEARDDANQVRVGSRRGERADSRPIAEPSKAGDARATAPSLKADDSRPIAVPSNADDSKPIALRSGGEAKTRPAPPAPPRKRVTPRPTAAERPSRSGATLSDGSGATTKSRTAPPSPPSSARFIDAAVAAALIDAEQPVAATPGHSGRDSAAVRGHTQPAPVVPVEESSPQRIDRTQVAAVSAPAPTPAPVARVDRAPPPPASRAMPVTVALRKAWRHVPNWAAAAAFGLLGLSVGVLVAGDSDDEGAAVADVPAARMAGAAPTPAHDPPPRPEPVRPVEVPEIVAIVEDTPQVLDESSEPPRRRSRRRARPAPVLETSSQPEPEPEPEPPPPRAKPRPPSASALLQQARSAFTDGDFAAAYRLARRSQATSGSNDALELMTRAACRRDDKASALAALRQLPLLDRAPVRRDCRRAGSRIGL